RQQRSALWGPACAIAVCGAVLLYANSQPYANWDLVIALCVAILTIGFYGIPVVVFCQLASLRDRSTPEGELSRSRIRGWAMAWILTVIMLLLRYMQAGPIAG